MTKRIFWLCAGAVSLTAGAFLYGIFRQDTYIGKLLAGFGFPGAAAQGPLPGFFSWYFPDFLWMFSLTCTVFAILLPNGKALLFWCGVCCVWGILWEVLQLLSAVSGTADWWDVCMYIIAVFTAGMINHLKRGK